MNTPTPAVATPSHKKANRNKLAFLAVFNILLIMGLMGQLVPFLEWARSHFTQAESDISVSIKKGLMVPGIVFVVSTCLEFFILIFPNTIHRKHKYAALAFLTFRKKHPNFGHQAFSKYIYDDDRIDPALLESHYKDRWPTTPEEQDKLYLDIQQSLGEATQMVADRHREKLLARESFTIAIMTAIASTSAALILIDIGWDWNYQFLTIIFFELLVCTFWANKTWRRHGNEVLAAETNRIRKLIQQQGDAPNDDSI